jgi:predicted ATPase/DNA-binding SARP family transcriptional activator/Tfp pilus assembly protein PilF
MGMEAGAGLVAWVYPSAVDIRLLGSLEVVDDSGAVVALSGAKLRGLLAALAMRPGQVVSADRLVEELWGEDPPAGVINSLQVLVSKLRRVLPTGVVLTRAPGYMLDVKAQTVDVGRFAQFAGEGRAALTAGDAEEAAGLFRDALGLWRGEALAEFAYDEFAQAETARLNEERLSVLEDRMDADLACGHHVELIGELEEAVSSQPLRERRRAQLMLALYRSGRQADALRQYQEARRVLGEELGIDPGAELRRLEAAMLAQDPNLDPPERTVPSAASRHLGTSPQTLTFLFTDIEGSTALLQRAGRKAYGRLLAEHHSLIRSALAANGGEEVGTQGDGFFAVFSSPGSCVAAAVEAQRSLETHPWMAGERVRVRMGVHAGEAEQTSTGLVGLDVHRAARVAGVAYGGQVVVSDAVAALVQDSLAPGVTLRDLGVHRLKDLGRPVRISQVCAEGLPVDFPPLRSLDNPAFQNNLPAQLGRFVGRDNELSELRDLVRSSRLVTLTGAGGSGKTRLALQVAAEMLDGSGDGVWLAELAAISEPDLVVPAISRALGLAPQPGKSTLEALTDALFPQDVLIVLDNCEHLIGTCAKTADVILRHCPRVQILATSREPLGITGETIYRVPSLSLPPADGPEASAPGASDAVDLFLDRAKAQGVDLAIDAESSSLLVSICRRLDGMPLAIELAAARVRSLSLADIAKRLDQRFRLLTGGSRSAFERQQTLRATVNWSYALLSEPERSLLRRLSVFAETFDLDAAEAVAAQTDLDLFDIADLLGSLVDKSLVVAEPVVAGLRYRLLETIRHFAAEQLIEAGENDAAAMAMAHCQHYLQVAEHAAKHLTGSDQATWLKRLDTDHANLRRALEHAVRDADLIEKALRFAVALRRYWMVRRRDEEALALLCPVLDRPQPDADAKLLAGAFVTVAVLSRSADLDTRLRHCTRAVEFSRQIDDPPRLVEALTRLSMSQTFSTGPETGMANAEEAVELARSLADDVLLAASMVGFLLSIQDADTAGAQQLYDEAIAATHRSGDQFFRLVLHNNAGVLALRTGDVATARPHFQQAAQIREAIEASSVEVLANLGWVLRQERDASGARSKFEETLRFSRRNGDWVGLTYAALGLACVASDQADWERASTLHGIAQSFLEKSETLWQQPQSDYRQASIDAICTYLGRAPYDHLYSTAKALTLDQAINSLVERPSARTDST